MVNKADCSMAEVAPTTGVNARETVNEVPAVLRVCCVTTPLANVVANASVKHWINGSSSVLPSSILDLVKVMANPNIGSTGEV